MKSNPIRASQTAKRQMLQIAACSSLACSGLWFSSQTAFAQERAPWKIAPNALKTQWADKVNPREPLPEYPRPQMTRKNWLNLNGMWDMALTDAAVMTPPATNNFNGQILVPFPYEAPLSGVGKASPAGNRLWYRRTFDLPGAWKNQRVLVHCGAVNWDSSVVVNGKTVGTHRGGYDGFSFDITDALKTGRNEIHISAHNPLKADVLDAQVLGKQRLKSGGIFYTGATGIWQTVWLEPVPAARIESLRATPDIDAGTLKLKVNAVGALNGRGMVEVFDGNKLWSRVVGDILDGELRMPIKSAKLWTPDNPFLYRMRVTLGNGKGADVVDSYFAMRKISLGKDEKGMNRILLNNQFVFQSGALDQGYWPDGIYTAPTDAALKFDIEFAKKIGWNMLRKHAKVEPARWYYHTDKMGMLVWQDMPQMYGGQNGALSDSAKAQFELEWRRILAQFHHFPSIVVWTTFNEGWGQHDTEKVVALTKSLDASRLVNNASGWVDKNVGDIHDTHAYPGPWTELPTETRAGVNGEFGGITLDAGHRWVNNAEVFGYGSTLKSSWLATKRYQDLIRNVYKLRDERGMSASVYTQITDVEQEINGLLTYDREVLKMDERVVAAANKGQFLPLPPNPNPDVVATSQDTPQTWRYSFEQPADNWNTVGFDDSAWKTGQGGFGKDAPNVRTPWTTTDIWIRRTFDLPANAPKNLAFALQHDEDAEVYLNGVLAAAVKGYVNDYAIVPMTPEGRAALKTGQNTIAVHVRQTVGGQAIDVGIVPNQ